MALAFRHAWRRGVCDVRPAFYIPAAGAPRIPWLAGACAARCSGDVRGMATASVPAALVKELRTRTGASMGKCRQALAEEDGNLENAVDWLRKRGIRSMERRTNESAESLLAICTHGAAGAIVELRAETDFVTKSDLFQKLAVCVAQTAAGKAASSESSFSGEVPLEATAGEVRDKLSAGVSVESALLELGSVLGERLVLGQSEQLGKTLSAESIVAGYAHPKHAGALLGTGRMAALVSLNASPSPGDEQKVGIASMASQLARHVVASRPQFVSVESVPADVLEKERNTMKEAYLKELDEKRKKNLDDAVLTKVLDGKTKKFFQDSVLLRQELTVPNAGGLGDKEAKPVSVEKWLKTEAKSMGLASIDVDDFRLVCL